MNNINIYFVDDLHGVKECYLWQIRQVEEIKPELVFLEMLPCEMKFVKLCRDLSEGLISVNDFKLQTGWEKTWGTFEGYGELFDFLHGKGIAIYPMDHSLEERKRLVTIEVNIIKNIKTNKDVKNLIDESRLTLFLERELTFSRNILKTIGKNQVNRVAVIVGGNHINRLVDFFNFMNEYDVEPRLLPKSLFLKLYPKFKELNLNYAKEKDISKMEYPPLVPINVLRYSLMNKK